MQPTSSDSLPFNQVLQGDCNAIAFTDGWLEGAADFRNEATALGR